MIGLILAVIVLIGGIVASIKMKDSDYSSLAGFAPLIGIVLAIVLVVVSSVSYVPTGYTGIVTTFGKVHEETLDAGINFHAPWDNVITMDNREQRVEFQLEAFSNRKHCAVIKPTQFLEA